MLPTLVLELLLLTNGAGVEPATTSKVWPVPPAVPLAPTEVRTTSTQWFPWIGTPQCDGDGNIYWHSGSLLQELMFVKLLTDGSSVTFHPAGSQSADLDFISYYVSHDGDLFVLATERANYEVLYLLKAGNDPGSFVSTRLHVPDGLDPMTINGFALLPSGETFLHGYFGKEAPKADQGRSYFLELDTSGRLEVIRAGVGPRPKRYWQGRRPVAGCPGYRRRRSYLCAGAWPGFRALPKITRKISLNPPKDGYDSPFDLRAAGHRLLLTWSKSVATRRHLETEYELLDGSTGEVLRLYRPTETKAMLVCFTGNTLIFDGGSKAGTNIKLVTAPAN